MSAVAVLKRRDPAAPLHLPPPRAADAPHAPCVPPALAPPAPDESALMGQVLSLRARLRAVEGALDCLRSAVFVLDAGAAVLFANRLARGLLDDADALVLHGRRLTATVNGDAARLREAVAALAANGATDGPHAARTLTIRRRSDRPSLLAVALPAASSERQGGRPGEVLLFVADPGAFGSAAASLLRDASGSPAARRAWRWPPCGWAACPPPPPNWAWR